MRGQPGERLDKPGALGHGAPAMDQPTRHLPASESENRAPIGFAEFVALTAALMALTALGIDSMLPALPAIAHDLEVANANERQFVVTAFLLGFAFAQLAYGPLADRYGRKPVLVAALAAYALTNAIAATSGSFELLLAARALSGAACAGARVVTVALVRDCFAGRAMARVMSLAFIVFMAAPILAPSFGTLVLQFGSWRWIFWGIGGVTLAVLAWFLARMPETLASADRMPLDLRRVAGGYLAVLRDRSAAGYTVAAALLSGGLFGFIGSVQQIVETTFGVPQYLPAIFAAVASTMALASFVNARIVMRLGTRRISHSALAGFVTLAALHLALTAAGGESLASFIVLQALMMACFGLATANFSAMAMEHMGHVAGIASSLQGFVTTLAGALIGAAIGQAYDGTTVPLYMGNLLMGVLALAVIFVAERGRMFRPS